MMDRSVFNNFDILHQSIFFFIWKKVAREVIGNLIAGVYVRCKFKVLCFPTYVFISSSGVLVACEIGILFIFSFSHYKHRCLKNV